MDFTPLEIFYWIVLGAGLYFLPSMIAWRRLLKVAPFITKINAALGWTLVGWVVALVWAIRRKSRMRTPSNRAYRLRRYSRVGYWTIMVLVGISAIAGAGGIDLFEPVESVASVFGGEGIFSLNEENLRADFERQGVAAVKSAYLSGQFTGHDKASAMRWLGEHNVPLPTEKPK